MKIPCATAFRGFVAHQKQSDRVRVYSRTHDHSNMAVAFTARVSAHFDVPAYQEVGVSDLVVFANGVASRP